MRNFIIFLIGFSLLFLNNTQARSLDEEGKSRVDSLYQAGEFQQAISLSKSQLKNLDLTHPSDSVYLFTYLGVMLAADPNTTAEAKNYMWKLLEMDPDAKISRLLPGERVYELWKRTKEEMALLNDQSEMADSSPAKLEDRGHIWRWWVLGGALVLGTATTVVFLSDDEEQQTAKTHRFKVIQE